MVSGYNNSSVIYNAFCGGPGKNGSIDSYLNS